MPLFEIKSLRFKFPGAQFFLADLNFDIPEKNFFALTGRNGSGKSTLVKILSGIFSSYQGDVTFSGKNLKSYDNKSLAQKLAYLPQQNSISDLNLRVYDFLYIARYNQKNFFTFTSDNKDKEIIDYTLELMEISELKEKKISTLSGGQIQKVLIALCLVQLDLTQNPENKVLIMDEPLTHLDIHYQFEIFSVLCKLIEEKGLTVIAVIHDLNLALKFTGKTLLLENGRIAALGNTKDVITEDILKKYFNISGRIVSEGDEYHLNINTNGL